MIFKTFVLYVKWLWSFGCCDLCSPGSYFLKAFIQSPCEKTFFSVFSPVALLILAVFKLIQYLHGPLKNTGVQLQVFS